MSNLSEAKSLRILKMADLFRSPESSFAPGWRLSTEMPQTGGGRWSAGEGYCWRPSGFIKHGWDIPWFNGIFSIGESPKNGPFSGTPCLITTGYCWIDLLVLYLRIEPES